MRFLKSLVVGHRAGREWQDSLNSKDGDLTEYSCGYVQANADCRVTSFIEGAIGWVQCRIA